MPGELAALLTALCWSFTTLFFTAAAERIGSIALNAVRLALALALIAAAHALLYGGLAFPVDATQLAYLASSGLVGLVLGDAFYFRSAVLLGPKPAALLMTLWPALAAFAAWIAFDEKLPASALAGVAVTLGGIVWSIAGRRRGERVESRGPLLGVVCGLLGAAGQALGLVLARRGLSGMEHELSGSMVRMGAAAVVAWIVALTVSPMKLIRAFRHRAAMGFASAGAFSGPFLGVWLSLYAATHGRLGVVSTLMATVPVLLIPLAAVFRKERPTLHELLGAVVAVGGVAILLNSRS